MGDDVKLVCLFKCKQCGVRMYEQDTKGHLERHGLTGVNGNWKTYFARGKKTQHSRPGEINISYRKQKAKPTAAALN